MPGEEIIRQLLKLLDEIEAGTREINTGVRVSIAKQLVRKLSQSKPDGDGA